MPYYQYDDNGKVVGEFSCPQDFETVFSAEALPLFEDYKTKRLREYPSLGDFADAFYWLQQGDATRMTAYLDACAAVKTLYPAADDTEESE